jgi:hypothetical protein
MGNTVRPVRRQGRGKAGRGSSWHREREVSGPGQTDPFTHFWAEAKPTKAAPTRAETTENFMMLVLVRCGVVGGGAAR